MLDSPPFDSVLLVGYGAPRRVEDVHTFLRIVLGRSGASPERVEEVARHYAHIGGSPLGALTFRQAESLEASLAAAGCPLPVYVGMRNWEPFLPYTLWSMGREGRRRAVGVILSPYRSEASWDRYQRAVQQGRDDLRALLGPDAIIPEVEFVGPYFDVPGFIEAQADRVREALGRSRELSGSLGAQSGSAVQTGTPPPRPSPTRGEGVAGTPPPRPSPTRGEGVAAASDYEIVFTAHSIPVEMAERSPYVAQLTEASRRVAEALGCDRWRLCWQSRSGRPDQPWLEPDVSEVLREIAAEGRGDQWRRRPAGASGPARVVLVPIGFLCDHVEVLYDLDVAAAQTAREVGIEMLRAGTVGDHPAFIHAWTELVVNALGGAGGSADRTSGRW